MTYLNVKDVFEEIKVIVLRAQRSEGSKIPGIWKAHHHFAYQKNLPLQQNNLSIKNI